MPYATQDRFGKIQVNPPGRKAGFLFDDDTVIYAHTLCGVLDGKLVNLEGNESTVTAILYSDERLDLSNEHANERLRRSDPYETIAEALSHLSAYLNHTDLVPGDEGKDVYLVDDNTVTKVDAGDGSTPRVGKVIKVSGDEAIVYIDGLY